jgi:citrate synthase
MNGYSPGLEGVIAAQTRLSSVDGQAGELIVRGFPVQTLATHAGYEEAAFLLWFDELPTAAQLADFRHALSARRSLPLATLALLQATAAQQASPMDALRMAAGTLGLRAEGEQRVDDPQRDALAVVARFPTVVASYWRLLHGLPVIAPRDDLGHAANALYMLTGVSPSPARVQALETYLVALIDHALNASTFTARTIISTGSDLFSAVTGAVGALKGPLHGGAPGPALQTVLDLSAPEQVEPYLRAKLERGERLMGFGHRDYKVRDPRTYVLAEAARRVYETEGRLDFFRLAQQVEQMAVRLLAEYKPGRNLYANVEFYAGLLLHGVGLPQALFTPTFAVARTAGWVAHCLEQQRLNRLMQPQSAYIGVAQRAWTPLELRQNEQASTNPRE